MKATRILNAIVIGAFAVFSFSCKKDSPTAPDTPGPKPENPDETVVPAPVPMDTLVYAFGQEAVKDQTYYYATIWKDGKRTLLSDGKYDAFCNAAFADNEYLYVVGCEATGDLIDDGFYDPYNANRGVLWKVKIGDETNVTKTNLSDGKYNTSPIAVTVVDGKVYAAGFDTPKFDRRVIMWSDGQQEYLTDGSSDALAYCICADGKDIYVGGYIQPADNKSGGIATIWKNGVAQSLTDGSTVAKVNAICVDNGKVYAAGAEKVSGGRWKGVLWIDGKAQYFTEEAGTEVCGLYVKDGKYVISGNMTGTGSASDISVYVWTNDGATKISSDDVCQGTGLSVAGKDVYVCGNQFIGYTEDYMEIYNGHLWKNGELQTLEVEAQDYSLWGVTFASVPKNKPE